MSSTAVYEFKYYIIIYTYSLFALKYYYISIVNVESASLQPRYERLAFAVITEHIYNIRLYIHRLYKLPNNIV